MQLSGLGERFKLPSGVCGGSPAEIEFGAYNKIYHLVTGYTVFVLQYAVKKYWQGKMYSSLYTNPTVGRATVLPRLPCTLPRR